MGYVARMRVCSTRTKEALLAFSLVIFAVQPSALDASSDRLVHRLRLCIYPVHVLEGSPVYASIEITRDNVVARQHKGT